LDADQARVPTVEAAHLVSDADQAKGAPVRVVQALERVTAVRQVS
jgi:hypothetical protein